MKRKSYIFVMAAAAVLSGCGGGGGASREPSAGNETRPPEPVTLRLYQSGNYLSAQDFNDLIQEPLKKKYPHITIENVVTKNDLPALIAASEPVDFFVTWNGNMAGYKDLGVYEDLAALAKKNNLDLSRFDPQSLDAIRSVSDQGELYALPYSANLNALYYNKDIFDKFGVPYPKDGMSWEDTIAIAARLTRTDSGVLYKGLDIDGVSRLTFPLSLTNVDAKTNKAAVNSEPFKKAFEIGKQIYSIPGNALDSGGAASWNRFIKDKTTAMTATVNLFLRFKENPELSWDVAQFPSYKDKPNVYGMYDLHVAIPLKTSKHRDDQLRVMEVLFSDEVQTAMVKKTARVSVMKDPKYAQMFGQDIPELKGKNIAGIFKSKPAPAPAFSIFETKASSLLNAEYVNVMNNKKDINTALRDAEENINQHISTQAVK
jgi:multiple sugar transport system substrate-binding protein